MMTPPMSLLQGFNLTSAESLNNLLVVINEEFKHQHKLDFTPKEFDEIFEQTRPKSDAWLRENVEWIEYCAS